MQCISRMSETEPKVDPNWPQIAIVLPTIECEKTQTLFAIISNALKKLLFKSEKI